MTLINKNIESDGKVLANDSSANPMFAAALHRRQTRGVAPRLFAARVAPTGATKLVAGDEVRHIVWFSCGAASTIVAQMVIKKEPLAILVYCDTGGEHDDNKRLIEDVERWLGKKILTLKSTQYENHFEVFEKTRYLNGVHGARCTAELKKKLRFEFQKPNDIQYFGFTIDEQHRADRFVKSFPEANAQFPLIEERWTKRMCAEELVRLGIQLPKMYQLGFNNNNCIGCCKGGKGYWNKIRTLFPEHFERMAKIEREIGHSCINGKFLDELTTTEGRHKDFKINCGFDCTEATNAV